MEESPRHNEDKEPNKKPIIVKTSWAKATQRILIAAIVVFAFLYVFHELVGCPGKTVVKSAQGISQVAKAFKTGTITTEFRDYVTTVGSTNYLQVTNLKVNEVFSRKETKKIMWEKVDLGDVEIEILAPVEYTFYLDLNDKWTFDFEEENLGIIVYAPVLKCNTPAVDFSKTKIREIKKSVFEDEEKLIEDLKMTITNKCIERGNTKIKFIRALARESTKEFIEKWMVNHRFKDYDIKPHVDEVYFADELNFEI